MADVEMNTVCEQFLMKGPFKGSVPVFKDKDDVKDLCRGEGPMGWKSVKWDAENKLWGTMEVGNIPRLLASGKWRPLGIQESWYGCLAQMAKAKSYFQAKVKTEKQEGKLAATAEQNEKERVAALEERKRREAEQQERTKLKSMVDSTDEEIQKVAEMGVDDGVAEYVLRMEKAFGPVAGMSPCGRILRWFGIKMTEARVNAYSETGASWIPADELAPYYASAQGRWVKALNEAAKRGDDSFDDAGATKRTKRRKKRKTYTDPETGADVTDTTTNQNEVSTFKATTVNKATVDDAPSYANYGAYCNVCVGTVNAQFPECMCGPLWVPCHECGTFVARHQLCPYGHAVEYPAECAPLL